MSEQPKQRLSDVESKWGELDGNHFGYASDEERLAKRGMEDWELTERIQHSQRKVPVWFFAVIAVVLLVAVGLSFPFWGQRPGVDKPWLDWGFAVALGYIALAGSFVYFMVNNQAHPDANEESESGKQDLEK